MRGAWLSTISTICPPPLRYSFSAESCSVVITEGWAVDFGARPRWKRRRETMDGWLLDEGYCVFCVFCVSSCRSRLSFFQVAVFSDWLRGVCGKMIKIWSFCFSFGGESPEGRITRPEITITRWRHTPLIGIHCASPQLPMGTLFPRCDSNIDVHFSSSLRKSERVGQLFADRCSLVVCV